MKPPVLESLYLKHLFVFAALLCFGLGSMAQDEYIIYGTVKDKDSFKKLADVDITVLKGRDVFDNITVGNNGRFEFYLPLGFDYTVIFEKDGYVSKRLLMKTSMIPEEDRSGGFETNTDMFLFEYIEGFNTSILEEPIGLMVFDAIKNSMEWDIDYTNQIKAKVDAEFARLENAAGAEAEKRARFDEAVAAGDAAMAKEDYAEALKKYNEALAIFPDEQPVQVKRDDAQAKLDELNAAEELEKQYQNLIANGEKNMSSEKWEAAKDNFNAALELKPAEQLPKDKLKEIDEILASMAERADFDKLVAEGDQNFDAEKYTESIAKYEAALNLFPKEQYPKDQILLAQEKLAELANAEAREKEYQDLIAAGEASMKDEKWVVAKEKFTSALDIKPDEQLPKDKLKEIESKLGDLAKREEFDKIIVIADQRFDAEDYKESITKYEEALAVLPDEKYPKDQIKLAQEKINALLDAERAKEELEKRYQELIASGESNMSAEKWEAARENYTEALELKPDERLPKDKLKEIEDKLGALADQEAYDKLIADADERFKSEDYGVSIEKYEEALKIMPKEEYPREQIRLAQAELDAMLDAERAKEERERRYKEFIALGDSNFDNENYEDARRPYEQALDIKPDEKYPKERLDEIERILEELARQAELDKLAAAENAEQDRINKEYQALVDSGNELFSGDDLEGAREKFVAASEVKPEERYPKNQIEEIDRLIKQREEDALAAKEREAENAELDKINKEYQRLIDQANELFDAEELTEARGVYTQASEVKPEEKYPKSRIQRIDEMLAEKSRAEDLAAEEEARQREEDRLAAERERLADEQRRDEERLRKLEEEKAEQERLAEEERRRREAEENRKRELMNNVSTSREDDVERYYREARTSEEKAKYNSIKKKKDQQQDMNNRLAEDNQDRREENLDELTEVREEMESIHRKGTDLQDKNKRFKAKEKEEWEMKDVEWSESFGYRRLANQEKAQDKKDQLESLSEKDRIRRQKVEQKEMDKEDYQELQQSYEKKGRALTTESEYAVDQKKLMVEEVSATGQDLQTEKSDAGNKKKTQYREFQNDASRASLERRSSRMDDIDKEKADHETFGQGKERMSEQKAESIELKKESAKVFNQNKAREAEIKSDTRRMELFNKDSGSEKTADDYILPEGAEDLQDGVNETSYELPGKTVIERTVKIGNKVDVYRKVISKTGTYYFKGNKSITEATWRRETTNPGD